MQVDISCLCAALHIIEISITVREVSFHGVKINSYVKLNQSFPGVGPEGRDRHGPGAAALVVVRVVQVAVVDGAQGGVVEGLKSCRIDSIRAPPHHRSLSVKTDIKGMVCLTLMRSDNRYIL